MVEYITTIVGTFCGALVGVDSGTILASCSSVAEFPLYLVSHDHIVKKFVCV